MFLGSLRYGGLRMGVELRPTLSCVLTMTGVLTPESFREVDLHAIDVTRGAALSWVADFSGCVLALGDEALEQATAMLTPDDPFSRPIAMIAADHQWELLQGHVERGIRYGFTRACFSDQRGATRWGDRMAFLAAERASAQRRKRGQSPPYTRQKPWPAGLGQSAHQIEWLSP